MKASLSKRLSAFALAFVLMLSAMYVPAFASEAPVAESEAQTVESAAIVDEAAPVADEEEVSGEADVRAPVVIDLYKDGDTTEWTGAATDGVEFRNVNAASDVVKPVAEVVTLSGGAIYDLYIKDKLVRAAIEITPAVASSKALKFYTVSYNTGDSDTVMDPTYLLDGDVISKPADPSNRLGFAFKYWVKAEADGKTPIDGTPYNFVDEDNNPDVISKLNGPMRLLAIYDGTKFAANIELNDEPIKTDLGLTVKSDEGTFAMQKITKVEDEQTTEYYTFVLPTTANVKYTMYDKAGNVVGRDILFTDDAQNPDKFYTVDFTAGAGTGTVPAQQIVPSGKKATSPSATEIAKLVAPEGKIFAYWKSVPVTDTYAMPQEFDFDAADGVKKQYVLEAQYATADVATATVKIDGQELTEAQSKIANRIKLVRVDGAGKAIAPSFSMTLKDGKFVFEVPSSMKGEKFALALDEYVANDGKTVYPLITATKTYTVLTDKSTPVVLNVYKLGLTDKEGKETATVANSEVLTQYAETKDLAEANVKLFAVPTNKDKQISGWEDTSNSDDVYPAKFTSIGDNDYKILLNNATFPASYNYGDKAAVTFQNKESVTIDNSEVTYTYYVRNENPNVEPIEIAGMPTDAGIYKIRADYRDVNGLLSRVEVPFEIKKKTVNVKITSATDKLYGKNDPAFKYELTDKTQLVSGDPITGTLTRKAGEGAGTYAFEGLKSTKGNGENYTIVYATASFTINLMPIKVIADAMTAAYGEAQKPITFTVEGDLASGDSFVGALALNETYGAAGDYTYALGTLSIKSVNTPKTGTNYTFTQDLATNKYVVNPAAAFSSVIAEEDVLVKSGQKVASVTFNTLTDTTKFVAADGATIAVDTASVEIDSLKGTSYTLNGNPTYNAGVVGFTFNEDITAGDTIRVSATVKGFKNYEEVKIVAAFTTTTNTVSELGTLVLTEKTPYASSNSVLVGKVYTGDTAKPWYYDNEAKKVVASTGDPATTTVTPSEVTYYTVKDGVEVAETKEQPTEAGLYRVKAVYTDSGTSTTYVSKVDFEISKRELTETWSKTEVTFTDKDVNPTLTFTGIVGEDDDKPIHKLTVDFTYTEKATGDSVAAANNANTYVAKAVLKGDGASNYELAGGDTHDFIINKAPLKVEQASDNTLPYNGAVQQPKYTLNGLVGNAIDVAVGVSSVSTDATPPVVLTDGAKYVGEYIAKLDTTTLTGTDKDNYRMLSSSVSQVKFKIVEKVLTPKFTETSVAYNGKAQAPKVTLEGIADGEIVKATMTFTPKTSSAIMNEVTNVGEYKAVIKLEGAHNKNYKLALDTDKTDFKITPATLKATWSNLAQEYTGSALKPSLTLAGVVNGEAVDATFKFTQDGKEVTEAKEIGKYEVTAVLSGAKAGNYTIDMPTKTFEITKEWVNPYTDVESNRFYYNGVRFMTQKGLMTGVDTDKFAPNDLTNRAMIATVMYRAAGSPAVTGKSNFVDVPDGKYYSNAVTWGVQNGLISGYGDEFRPMNNVSRQELVTFLYRFAEFMKVDVSVKADLSKYTDANKIMNFAKDAFGWAVGAEIITGMSPTTLDPLGTATRGQVATVFQRLVENVIGTK